MIERNAQSNNKRSCRWLVIANRSFRLKNQKRKSIDCCRGSQSLMLILIVKWKLKNSNIVQSCTISPLVFIIQNWIFIWSNLFKWNWNKREGTSRIKDKNEKIKKTHYYFQGCDIAIKLRKCLYKKDRYEMYKNVGKSKREYYCSLWILIFYYI